MRGWWSEILVFFASAVALAEAPVATVRPALVTLGSGEKVSVSVRVSRSGTRLRAVANVGHLAGPDDPAASEQQFTWSSPTTRFPQTALLLFWIEEPDSPPEVASVRIPLVGRTILQVNTEPGAEVRVQVAKASFGPMRADRRGQVAIPIDVPPGILTAQVAAESHDRLTTRAAPLHVPSANPLAAALSPDPIIHSESSWLIVAHTGLLNPSQLQVDVVGGTAQRATVLPDRVLFRITPSATSKHVRATAALSDQPDARAEAEADIETRGRVESDAWLSPPRWSAGASIGGFYGGGSNSGLALALDGSYALPFDGNRFSVDAEVGFRSAGLSAAVAGLGRIDSSVSAVLLELALRAFILHRGHWAVLARIGGGAMPFRSSARSDFQPSFTQSRLGYEAFVAGQIGYQLKGFELLAELRGALAPASTMNLDARLGGGVLMLGARYDLR